MAFASSDDPNAVDRIRAFMGPGHVDQLIRQAVQAAWMMLPEGKKTLSELEGVIHHTVDRALKDFREDAKAFGQGG
jgi:hypothetical protein